MNRTIVCVLWLALIVSSPFAIHAQCEGPEYSGFDFYLGDWEIEQQFLNPGDGSWTEVLPARTSVRKILDGCALLEHWEGEIIYPWEGMDSPRPLEGLSVRYWMPEKKVWKIQWMDSMQPVIGSGSVGTIADGQGEFEPETKPDNGKWSKIVFERRGDDVIDWHLEFTSDGGESWMTIWKMRMTRE